MATVKFHRGRSDTFQPKKKLNQIPRILNKDVQSFPTAFMSISAPDKEVCQEVKYFKSTQKKMAMM